MSVNKAILVGRLGRKPELRTTQSGNSVANFSIATSERRKDQTGEWSEHTEWHNVVCFGRTAENAANYLDKGRQVYVEGRIQTRNYEKDGQTHYRTEVVVNTLQFLGGRDDVASGGPSSGYNRSAPKAASGFSDTDPGNDIPF
jgi:single-strand DNA-binding protein